MPPRKDDQRSSQTDDATGHLFSTRILHHQLKLVPYSTGQAITLRAIKRYLIKIAFDNHWLHQTIAELAEM